MTLLPTWLPAVIAVAAGLVYVISSEGSLSSRIVVVFLVALSLVLQHLLHSTLYWSIGMILQVVVGVFVLVRLRIGT